MPSTLDGDTCPACNAPLVETEREAFCPNPTCDWDNDAPGVPPNEYNSHMDEEPDFPTGALRSILSERQRQTKMWGVRNHGLSTWHEIVSEELGEAAEANLERKFEGGDKHIGDVRDEYVQVAATALKVVEYIDREYFSE